MNFLFHGLTLLRISVPNRDNLNGFAEKASKISVCYNPLGIFRFPAV
jgi:hypothetical protein